MSDGFSEAMRGTYFRSEKYSFRSQRITPENINELSDNEIFVFGSNEGGKHGKGAAKQALTWGAKMGKGIGFQGKTYAIPTKDEKIKTLPVEKIKEYVDYFITFARQNNHLKFLVTEIGCGLAGYEPKDIAPLFKDVEYINNIYLPKRFWDLI